MIKADSVENPDLVSYKYFFRQDLTSKKYFYITTVAGEDPILVDKNITVSPDNSIPSLNDNIIKNDVGMDLDSAYQKATSLCSSPDYCSSLESKAQLIKTASNLIWQISFTYNSKPQIVQINSQTKAVIFNSPELTTISSPQ